MQTIKGMDIPAFNERRMQKVLKFVDIASIGANERFNHSGVFGKTLVIDARNNIHDKKDHPALRQDTNALRPNMEIATIPPVALQYIAPSVLSTGHAYACLIMKNNNSDPISVR